ncbi:MAG: M28 family metallopeptidase [Thermoleophilia bacterium]
MKRALLLLVVVGATALVAAGAHGSGAKRPDRFDAKRAFAFLRWQVELGPRPAGSAASRALAARLVKLLPGARYQAVPGGLRNVVYRVRGRDPKRFVVVGAHYDTKDYPGFVGANDGASGVAVVYELARALRPRTLRPTVVFVFFDGEESPDDSNFEANGMRGSKVAALIYRRAQAMILLDMIGDRDLAIPREQGSDLRLFARVRASATHVGAGQVFAGNTGTILDDHVPFARAGVPSVDLIDFSFPCWHKPCDDLTVVSAASLDTAGETVADVLRGF